ncbi:MAG: T9SS type A sorting domain-containing protein [Bacteroidota bacterium]
MKKIFPILLLFISLQSFAQITILNADMSRVNDTMRYSATGIGINATKAALTGADTIWDFTDLVPTSQDVEKFYAPSGTPYAIQFGILTGATYGIKDNTLNNLASFGSAAGITVENIYGFYKNTASASVLLGRGVTVSGLPLAINLNPRDTVYKFPLNYGDIDTTYYAGSTTIPGVGGISQKGRRVNIVDGWGVIKTPYGQFDCIRVKTEITGTDSIEVQTFKIPLPNNRTIYTWWAKGEHYPILEITQTTGGVGAPAIKYKDIYRAEAFVSAAKFNASRTTALTTDTINLTNSSIGTPKSYQWTITPNNALFVGGTNATTRSPRILLTQPGVYSVKLKVIYEGGEDDTVRINYITVNEAPKVNFVADKVTANVGEIVSFTDSSAGTPTVYRWVFTPNTVSFAGGTSASTKNPKVMFNAKGNYTVALTATYGTSQVTATKAAYISVQSVGVNTMADFTKTIKIYPNPAKEIIFIQADINIQEAKIDLINVLGKNTNAVIDFQSNYKASIDITNLPKGIYFVKIDDGKQLNVTRRLIVE